MIEFTEKSLHYHINFLDSFDNFENPRIDMLKELRFANL